jgi:hypothetical protein
MHRPPLDAIRLHCLQSCMNGHRSHVRSCTRAECPLHPFRMKRCPPGGRRLRAIRRFCLECTAGDRKLVRTCSERTTCPLWAYRIGVMPRTLARMARRRPIQRQLRLPGLARS